MNSFTHRVLAKMVDRQLHREFGVELSRRHLIWGSVKPDLVKTNISHFKDEKIQEFYNQWAKVKSINADTNLELFSEELGVVCHFLCDYFCTAHNTVELQTEMWPHLRYENQVHKVIKNLDERDFGFSYADYSQIPFSEILEYKHKLYLKRPFSIINDLHSSIEICLISAGKLFEESGITVTYKVS